MQKAAIFFLAMCLTLSLTACTNQPSDSGPATDGNMVDDAGDTIRRGVDDAGDAVRRGVRDTGDAVRRGVDDMGDAVREGLDDVGDAMTGMR